MSSKPLPYSLRTKQGVSLYHLYGLWGDLTGVRTHDQAIILMQWNPFIDSLYSQDSLVLSLDSF